MEKQNLMLRCLFSIVFMSMPLLSKAKDTAKKPNIVFILADDLGYADVNHNGGPIKTPHIDALAEGGIKLKTMYATPLCSPSRSALLTGRHAVTVGMNAKILSPGGKYGVPVRERLIFEELKDLGYKTYVRGKWHIGHAKVEYLPNHRGVDDFEGTHLGALTDYEKKEFEGDLDWFVNGKLHNTEGHVTEIITAGAEKIIHNHDQSSPFFLYLPHLAVHSPHQPPEYVEKEFAHIEDKELRDYYGMIRSLDDSVGRVVKALKEEGLLDDTIIVFASDNGGVNTEADLKALNAHAQKKVPTPASNAPYRGGKNTLYDGGVRVVSLAYWPGYIPAGSETQEMLHFVDWFPTFVELAGGEVSEKVEGKNIWEVLTKNAKSPHEELLFNVEKDKGAFRRGEWTLVVESDFDQFGSRIELFHASDVSQKQDLSKEYPELTEELLLRLNQYAKKNKPLFWQQLQPIFKYDADHRINTPDLLKADKACKD